MFTFLGRFERIKEKSCETFAEIIKEVCNALHSLNFLSDVPLAFFGYSGGTLMAYESAWYLQKVMNIKTSHILSLAGITFEGLARFVFFDDGTFEGYRKNVKLYLATNFGRCPWQFIEFLKDQPEEIVCEVVGYDHESNGYNKQWAVDFEKREVSDRVVDTDFLWIIGSDDPTTPLTDIGWKVCRFVGHYYYSAQSNRTYSSLFLCYRN